MTKQPLPTILIIIGITGDLSRRYLLPAIEQIAAAGELPADFRIVGTTRQQTSREDILRSVDASTPFLATHLEVYRLDPTEKDDYASLDAFLKTIEKTFGSSQRLFYLSVPPQVSWPVVELLGSSGLSTVPHTKLLLEKPFGTDLASAEQLIAHTDRYFRPSQVYRIDHYLAKEMAQNLVVFREANPLLRHTWHKDFIERIDITATESIDIEGRAGFYEQTGALRDVMQSHGLQLAALTLMEPPSDAARDDIPLRRLEALRKLRVASDHPVTDSVIRGQYEGYRTEVSNADSSVETYVRLTLTSSDTRWQGVPIHITTGKALPEKQTAIRITYRSEDGTEPNRLTLRIQPDAGIELQLWSKAPGYIHRLEKQSLRFSYADRTPKLPDAYEQVLLDAIRSNHTLFASSEEVRESWRILAPVQDAWNFSDADLIFYQKGSAPEAA